MRLDARRGYQHEHYIRFLKCPLDFGSPLLAQLQLLVPPHLSSISSQGVHETRGGGAVVGGVTEKDSRSLGGLSHA